MYIRESIKKVKGKKYIQHHLIESVRTSAGPRQKLVLNMGSLDLPRERWGELSKAIESHLGNQLKFFEFDKEIDTLSRHYTNLIIKSKLNQKDGENLEKSDNKQYEEIDISTLEVSDVRTVGIEHIVMNQLEEYNFDKIMKGNEFDEKQIAEAKIMIVGKLAHPASERETARWANEDSAIQEFIDIDHKIYDNGLHRTGLEIFEKREDIESELAEAAKGKFSLKETIILYDLTNTYFEGTKKESDMARPGLSKDKRDDRPLMTLALCVDDEGFPKHNRVFKGGISEAKTLETILVELSKHRDNFDIKKTIVIDAGIATKENIDMIKAKDFNYVVVSRQQTYGENFWKDGIEKKIFLNNNKSELKVKLVKTAEESFLLCYSIEKEAKESSIFTKRCKSFENEIENIRLGLFKKGTRKGYDSIRERIGRLKEKFKVGHLYDIIIEQNQGIATDIKCIRNGNYDEKASHIGEYVIKTNRMDLNEEQISKIHRMLSVVEDSFRSLKSELGLRPNFHQNDKSCESHIFITVIAYHILIAIQKRLSDKGIFYRWETIRNILNTHVRVTTAFINKKNDSIYIRTTSQPNYKQAEIFNALGIKQKPLKTLKIKILQKK